MSEKQNSSKTIRHERRAGWNLTLSSGSVAFTSLCLSLLSGIVIAFRFDPAAPYASTSAIIGVLPFGAFFRSIHYYSSHLFFIVLLWHVMSVIYRDSFGHWSPLAWMRLVLLLACSWLVQLTGFILRGDADARSAGAVFKKLLEGFPLGGTFLTALFFMPAEHPLVTLYLQHILLLSVTIAVLVWLHVQRFKALFRTFLLVSGVCALLSFGVPVSLGTVPDSFGGQHLSPWYFLGFQEMLRYLPLWLAGYVLPLVMVVTVFIVPMVPPGLFRTACRRGLGFFTIIYVMMTIVGYLRFFGILEYLDI